MQRQTSLTARPPAHTLVHTSAPSNQSDRGIAGCRATAVGLHAKLEYRYRTPKEINF